MPHLASVEALHALCGTDTELKTLLGTNNVVTRVSDLVLTVRVGKCFAIRSKGSILTPGLPVSSQTRKRYLVEGNWELGTYRHQRQYYQNWRTGSNGLNSRV